MASLRDRIRLGGKLASTSQEELQALSGQAGMASSPTTPVGAGMIGADPDQAKMAGTQAQKGASIRAGIQGQEDLRTAMRRQQTRGAATEEEKSALERGGRLEQLGGLQNRVQALVDQRQQQALAQGQEGLVAQLDANIPEELKGQLQPLIDQIRANPGDRQSMLQMANALGITDVKSVADLAAKVTEQFGSTAEQAGQRTAEAFGGESVADLNLEELGFEDINEVAGLLGMTPEELAGMSTDQLIQEAQAQVEEEFTQSEDLRRKLSDPNIGPAERAEARRQLREMGATGIKAAESDIDKMAEQIESADTVEFGGEEVEIGEMLEDEYLSGLTARYLNDDSGEFQAKLKETEPELAKWIDANAGALQDSVAQMETEAQEFAEIQLNNQQIRDDAGLDDELMKMVFDDWGELQTEEYNTEEVPVLDILTDENYPDKDRQTKLRGSIEELRDIDKSKTKELMSLNETELTRLGALDQTDKWRNIKDAVKQQSMLERVDPTDETNIVKAVFGPDKEPSEVYKQLMELQKRKNSPFFGTREEWMGKEGFEAFNKMFHYKEGVRPPKELLAAAKELLPEQSLRDMINNPTKSVRQQVDKLMEMNQAVDPTGVYDMVKDKLSWNDSVLDGNDGRELAKDLNNAQLNQIYMHPQSNRFMRQDTRREFESAVEKSQDYQDTLRSVLESTGKDFESVKSVRNSMKEQYNKIYGVGPAKLGQVPFNPNALPQMNTYLDNEVRPLLDNMKRQYENMPRGIERTLLSREYNRLNKDFQTRYITDKELKKMNRQAAKVMQSQQVPASQMTQVGQVPAGTIPSSPPPSRPTAAPAPSIPYQWQSLDRL